MNHPTIKYLQEYLKGKDYRGDRPDIYFYKLVEDAGVAEVEDFVLWCDKFGAANNMSFTVVVSEDPEKATEAMKAYL